MTKAGAKHKNDDNDDANDVEKNDDDDEVDVMPKVSRATHTSKVLPTCNTSFALQHFFPPTSSSSPPRDVLYTMFL